METLKGKECVEALLDKMKLKLLPFEGFQPHLVIIRVGDNPSDISYEKGAMKRMEKAGIRASNYRFDADVDPDKFMEAFRYLNNDEDVDGILIFRPLPKHLDEKLICNTIDPVKDMDCISPVNQAKLFAGDESGYAPCTAEAVMELLKTYHIDPAGKEVAIIGRSMVIGKPLAMLMIKANATVTVCHTKTKDIESVCRRADIVVACAGSAKMVTPAFLKNDAVVVDVGINVDKNGNLVGDVDFDAIKDVASAASPVPGGVGMITTSVLAMHVIKAALMRRELPEN
ncbi:MAG: bifunctional 5,10-methylenetetrahydrofolate dehydrogenase/5,10-methenyltetrahydrofolate cyclohydrolase [Lachnospiraceae bacterium]|jgi:methylenetetrahydrofolate dehydrogenase (NADP+)/methenyltetrahydrofolate cyclohydrolase|nr:bifunctional 5,10-methylenetetrahydrofolate dehydrogenase/5,10-methenyltetrahydrofolate cyclohydrolase [Lachnospiraceae bacterium]